MEKTNQTRFAMCSSLGRCAPAPQLIVKTKKTPYPILTYVHECVSMHMKVPGRPEEFAGSPGAGDPRSCVLTTVGAGNKCTDLSARAVGPLSSQVLFPGVGSWLQ